MMASGFLRIGKLAWRRWMISALAMIISLLLLGSGPLNVWGGRINALFSDLLIRVRADTVPEQRVIVIDIDENSLSEAGPWPWPRTRLADLIEILVTDYRVRHVGLDMVLPEPADADGDARLRSLAQHAPLTFAQAFDFVERDIPLDVGVPAGRPLDAPWQASQATGAIANHAGLSASPCVGSIGYIPDADGSLRHLPLAARLGDQEYPALPLAMLLCQGYTLWPQRLTAAAASWPIPYAHAWSAYTVIPAHRILSRTAPPGMLQGRWVLVGSSSLGLSDRVVTPLSNSTAGVMVHAAALSGLLDIHGGKAANAWNGTLVVVAWIMFTVIMFTRQLRRLSPFLAVAWLLINALAWLVAAYFVYPHAPTLQAGVPILCAALLLVLHVPHEWYLSRFEARRIKNVFEHYVAPQVLEQLLLSDSTYILQPRLLQVTTLIADIEGYSGLVERMSLDETVELTRELLDCMTRPVLACGGTLDKYTGDGLVAFWGAPLPQADHADLAIDAARAITSEVEDYNRRRLAAGWPPVRVRIGIESGPTVAGDMGTSFRSTYTALGDSVNIASRLQEQAKHHVAHIIIGSGAASCALRHPLQKLGVVQLRGRMTPLEIFTLADLPAD